MVCPCSGDESCSGGRGSHLDGHGEPLAALWLHFEAVHEVGEVVCRQRDVHEARKPRGNSPRFIRHGRHSVPGTGTPSRTQLWLDASTYLAIHT